jgi:hypothetical protein
MPVRMHLALDNENEPAWVEVKNLKDVVGGVSPTSQVIVLLIPKPYPGGQGVTKKCRLSWLTNSALVYEPKCGGGGCRVSANEYSCTQKPK